MIIGIYKKYGYPFTGRQERVEESKHVDVVVAIRY